MESSFDRKMYTQFYITTCSKKNYIEFCPLFLWKTTYYLCLRPIFLNNYSPLKSLSLKKATLDKKKNLISDISKETLYQFISTLLSQTKLRPISYN